MKEKIPTTILTGFLGSGKTTLLAHLLTHAGGKKIAVLINEFGALGMDEAIIKNQCDDNCQPKEMIELANGCICCTVAEDFLPAMEKILSRPDKPDHIIIETSGLAIPKPLLKAFQWHNIVEQTTIGAVVAVVDGSALAMGKLSTAVPTTELPKNHETEMNELFHEQLLSADLVILNKCDLLNQDQIKKITDDLKNGGALRSNVKIITSQHGKVSAEILLGMNQAVEHDLPNRKSFHEDENAEEHGHDDFASFVIAVPPIEDDIAFEEKLKKLINDHDILRIKGRVAVKGKPHPQLWQAVGARIEKYWVKAENPNQESGLVIIGLKGLDETAIKKQLA